MDRRSFVTKVLAGLAALPLIGKLVPAKPNDLIYDSHAGGMIGGESAEGWRYYPAECNWSFNEPSLFFDRELTPEERFQIHAYFNRKYGLPESAGSEMKRNGRIRHRLT